MHVKYCHMNYLNNDVIHNKLIYWTVMSQCLHGDAMCSQCALSRTRININCDVFHTYRYWWWRNTHTSVLIRACLRNNRNYDVHSHWMWCNSPMLTQYNDYNYDIPIMVQYHNNKNNSETKTPQREWNQVFGKEWSFVTFGDQTLQYVWYMASNLCTRYANLPQNVLNVFWFFLCEENPWLNNFETRKRSS